MTLLVKLVATESGRPIDYSRSQSGFFYSLDASSVFLRSVDVKMFQISIVIRHLEFGECHSIEKPNLINEDHGLKIVF